MTTYNAITVAAMMTAGEALAADWVARFGEHGASNDDGSPARPCFCEDDVICCEGHPEHPDHDLSVASCDDCGDETLEGDLVDGRCWACNDAQTRCPQCGCQPGDGYTDGCEGCEQTQRDLGCDRPWLR
jgi:hypothetical protein